MESNVVTTGPSGPPTFVSCRISVDQCSWPCVFGLMVCPNDVKCDNESVYDILVWGFDASCCLSCWWISVPVQADMAGRRVINRIVNVGRKSDSKGEDLIEMLGRMIRCGKTLY